MVSNSMRILMFKAAQLGGKVANITLSLLFDGSFQFDASDERAYENESDIKVFASIHIHHLWYLLLIVFNYEVELIVLG